jgi:hypothetical protein
MSAVLVQIAPVPAVEDEEITIIDDVDELVDSTKCSCSAGDDNPY